MRRISAKTPDPSVFAARRTWTCDYASVSYETSMLDIRKPTIIPTSTAPRAIGDREARARLGGCPRTRFSVFLRPPFLLFTQTRSLYRMQPGQESTASDTTSFSAAGPLPGSSPFSLLPDELIRTIATHLHPPDRFRRASWAGNPAYALDYFASVDKRIRRIALSVRWEVRSGLGSGRLLWQRGLTPCLRWEVGCNTAYNQPPGAAAAHSTIPVRTPRQVPFGIRQVCLEHNHIRGAARPGRCQSLCMQKLAELDNVRYSAGRQ